MAGLPCLHYHVEVLDLKTDYVIGSENTVGLKSIRFGMPDLNWWSCQFVSSKNDGDAPSTLDREAKSETDDIVSSESGKVAWSENNKNATSG